MLAWSELYLLPEREVVVAMVVALAVFFTLGAAPLATQEPAGPGGQCQLEFSARDATSPPRVTSIKQPSGQFNSWIGGGVVARCPAQSSTLTADSAEYFGDRKLLHLIGNVHYTEPRLTLDSRLANYFMAEAGGRGERSYCAAQRYHDGWAEDGVLPRSSRCAYDDPDGGARPPHDQSGAARLHRKG